MTHIDHAHGGVHHLGTSLFLRLCPYLRRAKYRGRAKVVHQLVVHLASALETLTHRNRNIKRQA